MTGSALHGHAGRQHHYNQYKGQENQRDDGQNAYDLEILCQLG